MSKRNLDNYATVKERKLDFYKNYPDGRINVELIENTDDKTVIKASVFKDAKEQQKGLPIGVGFAQELRDKEKKLNSYGKEYESVNFTSWLENCEESSIGRALDNAGFAKDKKCSREELIQAQRNLEARQKPPSKEKLLMVDEIMSKAKALCEGQDASAIGTFLTKKLGIKNIKHMKDELLNEDENELRDLLILLDTIKPGEING